MRTTRFPRLRCLPACLAAILLAGASIGCGGRASVTELSKEQQEYYSALKELLENQRDRLGVGLEEQLKADRVRQRNIYDWERDLDKAGVLLQVPPDATGNRKLLSLKLAELNLDSLAALQQLEVIEKDRRRALLDLYDAMIAGVEALAKNNEAIVEYLGSGNATIALRSLDVVGVIRAIDTVQAVGAELGVVEKRSGEERAKQRERLQKNIERARDAVLKALNRDKE